MAAVISCTQTVPLVYDAENTGADCTKPVMFPLNELPVIGSLPDPFMRTDGNGCVTHLKDWRCRRAEIGAMIQHYEIGTKPAPPKYLEATLSTDNLMTVTVIENDDTLILTSRITLPEGEGPFSAVTGCSFAGKIALYAGAFDERIALTIAQESGGGGAAAWRVKDVLEGNRETLRNAQGVPWYSQGLKQIDEAVTRLPYVHHELMAMVAPRAIFILGNPDYEWLADESGYVSCMAAKEVWKAFGVPDRFGFSIVTGHPHCRLPDNQKPEVEAFIDKFLLGDMTVNTEVATTPYNTDLSRWITW